MLFRRVMRIIAPERKYRAGDDDATRKFRRRIKVKQCSRRRLICSLIILAINMSLEIAGSNEKEAAEVMLDRGQRLIPAI